MSSTQYLCSDPYSPDFPPGLELICYPVYAFSFQLIGALYLAITPGSVLPDWFIPWLHLTLRHLTVLISSHQSHADSAIRLLLYQHAMELASDGIGISGMEVKPTLLFTNSKSARFINLGKSDPEFGEQLERIQAENFQELRSGKLNSSSRSFFYDDPQKGSLWVNYRTERVSVNGDSYVIAYCNMQDTARHNTGSHLEGLLSTREMDVINLIVQGLTNKEIASQLCVSVNTVKFHIARIYHKLHVTNRSELLSSIILRRE